MNIVELKKGDALEPYTAQPVNRLELIKYAGASGDYNPIHTIEEVAIELGLPGVIAHGMFTMARMALQFSPHLEHGYIAEFSTRFSGMVLLGDVITYTAEVVEATALTKTFAIEAKNQQGKTVSKGQLIFQCYD